MEAEITTEEIMDDYLSSSLLSHMPRFKNSSLIKESQNKLASLSGEKHVCGMDLIKEQFDNQDDICDATLVIYGRELKAHWCVLVGCPYFEAAHRSSLTGVRPDKITLDIAPFERVREAVSFLYDFQLEVYMESIKELLVIADYLHIDELRYRCSQMFLQRKRDILNIDNCVQFFWLAANYGDEIMHRKCLDFICMNFDNVVEQGDLWELPDYSMLTIIEDGTMNFLPCKKLFLLTTKWTEYDFSNRVSFLPQLLWALMPFIIWVSDEDLRKFICDHELVCRNEELADFIREITETSPYTDLVDCLMVAKPFRNLNMKRNYCAYIINEDRWVNLATPCIRVNKTMTNNNKLYQTLPRGDREHSVKMYDLSTTDDKCVGEETALAEEPYNYYKSRIENMKFAVGDEILQLMMTTTGEAPQDPTGLTIFSFLRILDKSNGVFNELPETFHQGFLGSKILDCTVNNRYLCLLATQERHENILQHEFVRNIFFNYDVVTKSVICDTPPDVNVSEVIYMYAYDDKAIIGEYGLDMAHVLDFSARRINWRRNYNLAIAECPFGSILQYENRDLFERSYRPFYQLVTHNDYLYSLINGDQIERGYSDCILRKTVVVQYNILNKQWSLFQQYHGPTFIDEKWHGLHFVQLSRHLVRCTYKCPHCKSRIDANTIYREDLEEFIDIYGKNYREPFRVHCDENSDSDS